MTMEVEQTTDRSGLKAVMGRDSIENQSDRQLDIDGIKRGESGNYGNKLSQDAEDISENARQYADFWLFETSCLMREQIGH